MIIVEPHKNGNGVFVKALQVEQIVKGKKIQGLFFY